VPVTIRFEAWDEVPPEWRAQFLGTLRENLTPKQPAPSVRQRIPGDEVLAVTGIALAGFGSATDIIYHGVSVGGLGVEGVIAGGLIAAGTAAASAARIIGRRRARDG
jgi:hypothetical protein